MKTSCTRSSSSSSRPSKPDADRRDIRRIAPEQIAELLLADHASPSSPAADRGQIWWPRARSASKGSKALRPPRSTQRAAHAACSAAQRRRHRNRCRQWPGGSISPRCRTKSIRHRVSVQRLIGWTACALRASEGPLRAADEAVASRISRWHGGCFAGVLVSTTAFWKRVLACSPPRSSSLVGCGRSDDDGPTADRAGARDAPAAGAADADAAADAGARRAARVGADRTAPGRAAARPRACRSTRASSIITADGTDAAFEAITSTLGFLGTPYDVLNATTGPTLTAGALADGDHGKYQAIFLDVGDLSVNGASAFTNDEWTTLSAYEARFGVRRVALYTYPTTAYGLVAGGGSDQPARRTRSTTHCSAAGAAAFVGANCANAGHHRRGLGLSGARRRRADGPAADRRRGQRLRGDPHLSRRPRGAGAHVRAGAVRDPHARSSATAW